MGVTRRQLLAAMAAVPVAGGLCAGGLGWRWWDRPAAEGLQALSPREHAFAQAVAEAWMPPGGDPPLSGAEAGLGDYLDGVVASGEPGMARELKLLLGALDDLTVPTRLRSFRHLPLEVRREVLDGWLRSDLSLLRGAAQSVVVLLSMGWTTHPEVARRLQSSFACGYGR